MICIISSWPQWSKWQKYNLQKYKRLTIGHDFTATKSTPQNIRKTSIRYALEMRVQQMTETTPFSYDFVCLPRGMRFGVATKQENSSKISKM